jgi:PAS domain S-box-containing protein
MEKLIEDLLTEGFDWIRTYNDAPEGIFLLNHNHEIIMINQTMLGMLGLSSYEEAKGKKCYEIFHGTDKPPSVCVHAKVMHSNHCESIEVTRDDKIYHVVETPLFSKKNHIVGYVHSSYDITDQKQADLMMREAREKFETIFTKFPIGILVENVNSGEILDVNEYLCDMLSYSRKELTKLTIYDISHPDDYKISREHATQAGIDGLSYKLTKRYITKFGQIRWVYVVVAPITDSIGQVVYAFSMVEDITDKVFSQREIAYQKDLLKTYLDLVRVIIVSLDRHGNITMINRRGRELLGKAEKDLIGKNWFLNYVPEQELKDVTMTFDQLMKGELSLNGDAPNYFTNLIKIAGGKELTILWHNTILRDSEGNISGVLSAGEDITNTRVE